MTDLHHGPNDSSSDPADPVVVALEECLAAQAEGRPWSAEDFRDQVGERWEEFEECVRITLEMEPLGALFRGDEPEEDLPKAIGPFQVVRLLGRGGFASVYLAIDPKLARPVALKCFHASSDRVEALRDWLADEARSLAQIRHEGVLGVHELLEAEGVQALVTDYVPGPSLEDALAALRLAAGLDAGPEAARRGQPAAEHLQSLEGRCRLVTRLAQALAACHGAGVLHRDVKPSNVLLAHGKEPILIDFGLAHLDRGQAPGGLTEAFVGSAAYLAPEQAAEERTGDEPASDQFSLGLVLAELLTLENPFLRRTREATQRAIAEAEPPTLRAAGLALPTDLTWILRRTLERLPEDRYPSLSAFAADLEAFLAHEPVQAGPPSVGRRVRRVWRRHARRVKYVLAGALLALVTVLAWLGMRDRQRWDQWTADLEQTQSGLTQVEDLPSLEAALAASLDLRRRAQGLGSVPKDLEHHEHDLHDQADRMLSMATQAALRAEVEMSQRELALNSLAQAWSGIRPRLVELRPRSPFATPGTKVSLPEGAELLSLAPGARPGLQPVEDPSNVPPGSYRLRLRGPNGFEEQEFLLHPGQHAHHPELAKRPAWLGPLLVEVQGSEGLAGFRLMGRDVVLEDFRRHFSEEELAYLPKLLEIMDWSEADCPHTWSMAQELARRVGGRLPHPEELWLAYRQGVLPEQGAQYWTGSALINGELRLVTSDQLRAESLERLDEHIRLDEDGHKIGMSLRVVVPGLGR